MAIQFVLHNTADTPAGDKTYIKGQKFVVMIASWCHSLGKAIGLQRQRHSTKITDEIGLVEEPHEFLDSEEVLVKLHQALKRLETSNQINDIKIVTAYLAASFIYDNGQSSGVVENLTTEEFLARKEDPVTGEMVIYCHHHKTGPQGIAEVVINKTVEQLMESYFKYVRQRLQPDNNVSHLYFLTPTGRRYTQVFRKMKEAFETILDINIKLPPPAKYRIVVATDCSKEMSDQGLRTVAKHMSHSSETARKYYENLDLSDAVSAKRTIVHMAQQRKWSDEESKNLLEAWPLQNPKPDMKTCQIIKDTYQLERTSKNILDKWRQLKARDD